MAKKFMYVCFGFLALVASCHVDDSGSLSSQMT
jgi:hypothetical protein